MTVMAVFSSNVVELAFQIENKGPSIMYLPLAKVRCFLSRCLQSTSYRSGNKRTHKSDLHCATVASQAWLVLAVILADE